MTRAGSPQGFCLALLVASLAGPAACLDGLLTSAALAQEVDDKAQPVASGTGNELVPTYAELLALRRGLGSEQPDQRESSLTALMELGGEALPVLRERLRAIGSGLAPKALSGPMQALRKQAGGPTGDLASGILPTLDNDRSEPMLLLCELVALLRALEAQHSLAATQLIVSELFVLDPKLFRPEAVRERKQLGKLLLPAYLRHRSDARPALQKLASESLSALGSASEERLFSQPEGDLQAAVLVAAGDAYAASAKAPPRATTRAREEVAREQSAVRWVVALLDDTRPEVREAARRTTRVFGEAADEPLRERSLDVLGAPADPAWTTARVLDQLIAHLDEDRTQRASAAVVAARNALEKGELGEVEQQLALALADDPNDELRGRIASAYQELGKRLDQADLPTRALVASRRAVRLAPDSKPARARALYLEAERRLGDGVADLQALREASTLDPSHPDASPLLDELRGGRITNARELRRQLGFLAAGLFAVAACLVLYFRRVALQRAKVAARKEGSVSKTLPSTV